MSTAIKKIKEASKKKAKIICLPELFLSNYFCQQEKHSNFNLAEKIPGKNTNILCSLAKELKVIIIAPIFEKKTTGIYHNSCVVINEKGKLSDPTYGNFLKSISSNIQNTSPVVAYTSFIIGKS